MRSNLFIKLVIIFCLAIIPFAKTQAATKDIIAISNPNASWFLNMHLPDFELDPILSGDNYFFASNEKTGMIISTSIGEAKKEGDAVICRDQLWEEFKDSPFKMTSIRKWKYKKMQFKSYMVNEFEGLKMNQKNLIGCLVQGDSWITLHLSKVNYTSRDFKLFTNVLKNIKILDEKITTEINEKSNINQIKGSKSLDYFLKGNEYFHNEDYKNAISYYRVAFNLEKKTLTFGELEWHVLIDNFGMAYGITGDYKRAKDVFEYGIKYSPRYTMFYYNLACNYAEQGNLKKTISYLSKAYLYRNNTLPGEKLSNPYEDESFKEFWDNPQFKRIADRIVKAIK